MTDQKPKIKPKRLSKGQRIHLRRVKQAANKEPIVTRLRVKKGA